MRRFTITAISLLLMGTLVACGDDDGTSTPSAASSEDGGDTSDPAPTGEGSASDDEEAGGADEEADGDGGDVPAGEAGIVAADGQTYEFNRVVKCEPPEAGIPGHETTLAISALAGDGIAVHVRVSEAADRVFHDLDFYGPDGAYNGGASTVGDSWVDSVDATIPESPLNITDDRISGTVTVLNTRATDETIDIDVDIPVPAEVSTC